MLVQPNYAPHRPFDPEHFAALIINSIEGSGGATPSRMFTALPPGKQIKNIDRRKTNLDQHQSVISIKKVIFHPLGILGLSLGTGALFTLYVIYKTDGIVLSWLIWYIMPVGVVFTAFILDRVKELGHTPVQYLFLDLIVVLLSLARVVTYIPFYSGHAIFLSYTLLSARLRMVKILAMAVLLQVVYLKLVRWNDWVTLVMGVLAGSLAGYYRISKINQELVR